MKILQANNYHYIKGGSERVYLDTINLLEDKGHDVASFSVSDPESPGSSYSNYFIRPVSYNNQGLLSGLGKGFRFIFSSESRKKLDKLLYDFRPDIVHLHIFYGRLTSSIIPVIRKHGIPIVMTVHEYKMLCPVYSLLDNKGNICEKCCNKGYFHCITSKCCKGNIPYSILQSLESYIRDLFFSYEKNIDMFIMPSSFIMKKHLQYRKQMTEKTKVINNFVDINQYKPVSTRGKYYLYAGRISKEKGLLTLIDAFRDFGNLSLKIAGDGPLMGMVKGRISRDNIKNIEVLGYVRSDLLKKLVREAGFLVIPSEWYENNPMSLIEAMASGKPAIGADIGGIPEIIKDGFNGYLFKPGDKRSLSSAIEKTASITDEIYRLLSDNAVKTVSEKFSRERYYKDIIKVYDQVIRKAVK